MGTDIRLEGHFQTEGEDGNSSNLFMPHLALSESSPNEIGFDNIRIRNEQDPDGLNSRSVMWQSGLTLADNQTLSFSLGRTTDERLMLDPTASADRELTAAEAASAPIEYGSIQTHTALEFSLGEQVSSVQAVSMRQETILNESNGLAASISAAFADNGEGYEIGLTTMSSSGDSQSSCYLGLASSSGNIRAPANRPTFNTGARNSFDCEVVIGQDDQGSYGQIEVGYTRNGDNGNFLNMSIQGDFREDSDPELRAGISLGMRFKQRIDANGKGDEEEEKQEEAQEGQK
jgi:hypothetical protein